MPSVDYLHPVVHKKFHLYSSSKLYHCQRLSFYRAQFRVFQHDSKRFASSLVPFPSANLYKQGQALKVLGGCVRNNGGFRSKIFASTQDSDSGEKSEAKSSEGLSVNQKSNNTNPTTCNRRREKQGKANLWWSKGGKWRWQPIVRAQEIGSLLLQLGIMVFIMRFLRLGFPLPGSEPRITSMSVPYSEFLSKVNSNQVEKVEVDGVHIRFKLKSEGISQEGEVGMGISASKFQESESLVRSVPPTKRVVHKTIRPNDIKTPYEKMIENEVVFFSSEKHSGGFLNSALVRLQLLDFICCRIKMFYH